MQNLLTGLLTQLSPKAREHDASRAALSRIIDRLEQKKVDLEERLSTESRRANKRRLQLSLEATRLQLKKAVSLRSNLA
jgi:exonuclease VII small subunit